MYKTPNTLEGGGICHGLSLQRLVVTKRRIRPMRLVGLFLFLPEQLEVTDYQDNQWKIPRHRGTMTPQLLITDSPLLSKVCEFGQQIIWKKRHPIFLMCNAVVSYIHCFEACFVSLFLLAIQFHWVLHHCGLHISLINSLIHSCINGSEWS